MLVDSWAMPTDCPEQVHEARQRLEDGRCTSTLRREVDADGKPSPDANPLTNRFGLIPVPDSVTPWAYTPEAWTPRPSFDEDLLEQLWTHIYLEGADDLDLGANSDSAFASAASEADEAEPFAASVPSLQAIAKMTESYKKKQGPSTTGGSTTAGGSTVARTFTSAASTTGTEATKKD